MKKTKFYVALYEIFISRRVLAPSSAKYKVPRRVLAPSSFKYKVMRFRYASWQVNCSALVYGALLLYWLTEYKLPTIG